MQKHAEKPKPTGPSSLVRNVYMCAYD